MMDRRKRTCSLGKSITLKRSVEDLGIHREWSPVIYQQPLKRIELVTEPQSFGG